MINGYEVSYDPSSLELTIEEVGLTKSWQSMMSFCKVIPDPCDGRWDAFVVKHTQMQEKELQVVIRKAHIMLRERLMGIASR